METHGWSMGAVTRSTGLTAHTLRAWERRFGFPRPARLPSGHRRYPAEEVGRLRLIVEALRRGHRAGDVVPLPEAEIRRLLTGGAAPAPDQGRWIAGLLELARLFRHEEIAASLRRQATILGAIRFVRERIEPLLRSVGEAWAQGELDIRHEHFVSGVVEDELRALRAALPPGGHGRPMLLATLPGELHGFGIQMVALLVAAAGREVRTLGVQTPIDEVVAAAGSLGPWVVGISISAAAPAAATAEVVGELRRRLPEAVKLWLGGDGSQRLAALPETIRVVEDLGELQQELAV